MVSTQPVIKSPLLTAGPEKGTPLSAETPETEGLDFVSCFLGLQGASDKEVSAGNGKNLPAQLLAEDKQNLQPAKGRKGEFLFGLDLAQSLPVGPRPLANDTTPQLGFFAKGQTEVLPGLNPQAKLVQPIPIELGLKNPPSAKALAGFEFASPKLEITQLGLTAKPNLKIDPAISALILQSQTNNKIGGEALTKAEKPQVMAALTKAEKPQVMAALTKAEKPEVMVAPTNPWLAQHLSPKKAVPLEAPLSTTTPKVEVVAFRSDLPNRPSAELKPMSTDGNTSKVGAAVPKAENPIVDRLRTELKPALAPTRTASAAYQAAAAGSYPAANAVRAAAPSNQRAEVEGPSPTLKKSEVRKDYDSESLSGLEANNGTPKLATPVATHVEAPSTPDRTTVPELFKRVDSMVHQGGGKMTVSLNPPELGQVEVQVTARGKKIEIEMKSDSERTKSLLQTHATDLKHSMQSHDLVLSKMDVQLSKETTQPTFQERFAGNSDNQNFQRNFQQASEDRGQQREKSDLLGVFQNSRMVTSGSRNPVLASARTVTAAGGVDLRI